MGRDEGLFNLRNKLFVLMNRLFFEMVIEIRCFCVHKIRDMEEET